MQLIIQIDDVRCIYFMTIATKTIAIHEIRDFLYGFVLTCEIDSEFAIDVFRVRCLCTTNVKYNYSTSDYSSFVEKKIW